jgi:hypothetical protein
MTMVRDRGRLRPLVVTLYPNGTMGLRPSKTRKEEIISLESCYETAIKQRVAREQAERSAGKKKSFKRGLIRK